MLNSQKRSVKLTTTVEHWYETNVQRWQTERGCIVSLYLNSHSPEKSTTNESFNAIDPKNDLLFQTFS